MEKRLFGTNTLVDEKTAFLNLIETKDYGWSKIYLDPNTNEKWLQYSVDPDRGYFYNLVRIDPELTKYDLIQIAIHSVYFDEAFAAAQRLFYTESLLSYADDLLIQIESLDLVMLDEKSKEKFKGVIQAARLNSRFNYNSVLNKLKEIVDYEYAQQLKIADRGEKLLNILSS